MSAKFRSALKFKALIFGDGARGSYFQYYECVRYPCLHVRIHGMRGSKKFEKQILVVKDNLDVKSFKTIEDALPLARKQTWKISHEKSSR